MTRESHGTVRALVVDGSAAARTRVAGTLEGDGDIVVVGQAGTVVDAVALALRLRPDIVTLGLYLPGGGGQQAIEQIMAQVPTPILVLSHDSVDRRSPSIVDALVAGALDALPKLEQWSPDQAAQLRRTVRLLRNVHVIRHPRGGQNPDADSSSRPATTTAHHVVAIAASTGGPSALAIVLAGLGGSLAPVLIVQHLHPDFTTGLIEWMSRVSALPVELAEHGQVPRAGRVYVAPGGVHLRLAAGPRLELDPDPITIHRPSADQLFLSVAARAGGSAIGVLLTGMGDDGAKGLLAIHQRGGRTLAQDEASSAVFGMAAAAQRLGAVTQMLPPAELGRAISDATRQRPR